MKYKVGDKVRVKSLEWYNAFSNNGKEYIRHGGSWFTFTKEMCEYGGKTATVVKINKDLYHLDIDNGECGWFDWMLEDNSLYEADFDGAELKDTIEVIKEKRFHAACSAMQGVIASGIYNLNDTDSIDDIVFDSYKLADELLKQGGFTE